MQLLRESLIGAAIGLLVTVFAIVFPTLGLPLAILVVIGLWRMSGGWLMGALLAAGILIVALAVNTGIDCARTDDFCGHTDIVPGILLGAGIVIAGLAAGVRRSRRLAR